MRRTCLAPLIVLLVAVVTPAWGTLPLLKQAEALKITSVKNCASCHVGPPKKQGQLTDRGNWLMAQLAVNKAGVVDVAWLKDYKGK